DQEDSRHRASGPQVRPWNRAQLGRDRLAGRLVNPLQLMPAEGQREMQRELVASGFVEFLELGPKPRHLDSYGGIHFWLEIGAPAERLRGNGVFADRFALVVPEVQQERTHGGRGPERLAVRDLADQRIILVCGVMYLFGRHRIPATFESC